MTTRYLILTTSDESFSKKFKVLWTGYTPMKLKKQTELTTLDGKWSITQGGLYERREFTFKVRETEPNVEYGNFQDLETLFDYNSPNPSSGPSNKFNMIDHYGREYIVMFSQNFIPQPLSVVLEGEYAFFVIHVAFILLSRVGS